MDMEKYQEHVRDFILYRGDDDLDDVTEVIAVRVGEAETA